MRQFFNGVKFRITAAICVSLLLGIFIAAVSENGSSPLSSVLGTVVSPLAEVSRQISEKMSDFRAGFVSSSAYREEISSLSEELESCKEELVDHEKLQHKLQAYEAFLDVKEENPDYSFLPATVILRDASDIYSSFSINKGSDDGLKINMPVIFGKHLVGIVKELTANTAVVYSLLDPTVSVSAYEIRTREDCYTESDTLLSSQGLIKLSGLSRSTPVVSGGIVCTSGIGGIYPRDLIIGTVTQVENSETDISAYAVVEPDIDVTAIVDVFVITDFKGKTE